MSPLRSTLAAVLAAASLGSVAPSPASADPGTSPSWGYDVPADGAVFLSGTTPTADVVVNAEDDAPTVTASLDTVGDAGSWTHVEAWQTSGGTAGDLRHVFVLATDPGSHTYRLRIYVGDETDPALDRSFSYTVQPPPESTGGSAVAAAGSPTRTTLTVPHRRHARLHAHLSVHGTLTAAAGTPLPGHRVVMQVRAVSGWSQVPGSDTLTDAHGRFALAVPTYFYGRHVYRAYAPAVAGWTASGSPQTGRIRVPLGYQPLGARRSHTFRDGSATRPGARWNGCEPIPYRLDLAGAPPGAATLVRRALARVSAATGFRFVSRGRTSYLPWGPRPRTAPAGLVIAWSTPSTVPQLRHGHIGLGGATAFGATVDGVTRITSGGIVLDRSYPRWRRGFDTTRTQAAMGAILLHELGHAMGLDHVKDPRQIMYSDVAPASRGRYQAGDLAALRRIGLQAGCLG